ncbi:MAG: restriction endonuclease subunit S [Stenotrophomonas sp.]
MPRLRLVEFRNDQGWSLWRLSDLVEFSSGGTPSKAEPRYWGGDIPWISASSMYEAEIADSDLRVTSQAIGNGTRLAPRGSLLVLVRGSMLFNRVPMGIAVIDVAFNQDVKALKIGSGLNARFLLNQLIAISPRIPIDETGIGAGKIETDTLANLPIYLPSEAEQQKIADCLTSLDEMIAAQGRKVEALKAHKRGLMQQLFPREGETRPRLRFPEFRDAPEWTEKKLSSLVDLVSGMHLSPDQYSCSGEVPYFTGPSDFTNYVGDVRKWTSPASSVAMQHDTLITVKGSGVGECWYLEMPFVAMGRQLMAVHAKTSSSRFINQFLLTKRTRFEDLASGNLIPGLSRGDILDMVAPFPKKDEQQRIADCLSSLDTRITAETQQLAALKTHKQGLMQQLFPVAEVG